MKKKVNRADFERHPFVCISGQDAGTPQRTGRNRHLKPEQGVRTGQQVTDTQVNQNNSMYLFHGIYRQNTEFWSIQRSYLAWFLLSRRTMGRGHFQGKK